MKQLVLHLDRGRMASGCAVYLRCRRTTETARKTLESGDKATEPTAIRQARTINVEREHSRNPLLSITVMSQIDSEPVV